MSYETNSDQVRRMFASIAQRYDRTNDLLCMGMHHWWRRQLQKRLLKCESVLDLATGTGALVPYLLRKATRVVAADFCAPMLEHAPVSLKKDSRVEFVCADALQLPFEDASFDCVTVAFGVRNFEVLEQGLAEMQRVLKPGGQVLILEFGQVQQPLLRKLFEWYSFKVMPYLGGFLTGDRAAYEYLPKTSAQFPCDEAFQCILEQQGYQQVVIKRLLGGVVYLYDARVGG